VAPESIARLVCHIVEGSAKSPRYTCGAALQRLSAVLKRILPGRLFETVIGSFYGM
jgi:hypothetical protein